jgi:hypothetical protein
VGGLVLVGLGPVTALVGAMVLVVASNPYIQEYPYPSAPSDQTAAKTVGGVMIGVGAALTIGGILLVTGNAHSHVEQGVARPKNDAWLRLPTWRDRREDPLAGSLPQAVGVPLIDTTF